MIVDVHSHAFLPEEHFAETWVRQAARVGSADLTVRLADYRATAPAETKTVVFGGKARLSGLWVPDGFVAEYVSQDPERLVGFLSLDPTQPGWREELEHGHRELGLRGVKLMPMYSGFRPDDHELDDLWRYAGEHGLPVLLHTGTTFIAQAPLEYTLPRHLDTVAIRFPEVRIVMAHLGHPYEGECIAVARKHERVFADVSALHYRPFQLFHSLMLVQEYGVWEKVLFGTDYPFTTVDASIAGLRGLNARMEAPAGARLDEDEIERLIHRDGLAALGLA